MDVVHLQVLVAAVGIMAVMLAVALVRDYGSQGLLIATVLGVGLVLLLALTNPGPDEFVQYVQATAYAESDSQLAATFSAWASQLVTTRSNYVLCSVYHVSVPGYGSFDVLAILGQFVPLLR